MSKEVATVLKDYISAINIDLKCFSENGYAALSGRLKPVCDNIKYFYEEKIITEVTTLIVPKFNDSEEELRQLAKFLA